MTRSLRPRARRIGVIAGAVMVTLLLAGCASGSTDGAAGGTGTSASAGPGENAPSSGQTPSAAPATGPTVVVTVPDLQDAAAVPASPSTATGPSPGAASVESAAAPGASVSTTEAAPAEAAPASPTNPADAAPPAAPAAPGDGLTVQLANCDGCSVLATHRDVVGGLSAALVSSPGGRALLLSVRGDGTVAGVVNVPYGSSFPTPAGGVLPCDSQAHCAVQGVQSDGRAMLSAFALTETGAWRNISGDDAFPSVTERAAVVDLDGQLGLAVQDQGTGDPVWLLYRWLGDRFTVAGCATDGDAPTTVGAVSPEKCLS